MTEVLDLAEHPFLEAIIRNVCFFTFNSRSSKVPTKAPAQRGILLPLRLPVWKEDWFLS